MRTSQMTDVEFLTFLASHPVSGGKGEDAARATRDREYEMQKASFDKQMAIMNQLSGAYSKYLTGKIGYDPSALAAMRSQFLNSNASTFNQAGGMVKEALGARGELGSNPIGGNYIRGLSSLLGARAGSQSQGLLGIQEQNAQLGLQNMWNAGNVLSGNAAVLTGTQGVAGSALSNALNAQMQAENSGFGASFMNAFGGAVGKGLGSFVTGGAANLFGGGK